MWGLIILWKKKCCLWVATDLNSSISFKALSPSLSSCRCNSAFVGFLILNRIGLLRHVSVLGFSLIFAWTQAVRVLMQVWRFILTVLTDLFNPHLRANCRHTHRESFDNVFGLAFCFPCCILLKSYLWLQIVLLLCMWSKIRIVLSIISVWLMIKAGVKHFMTMGNRTWYSCKGSAVSVHLFCLDLFMWLEDHLKHSHSHIAFFWFRIQGVSLWVPTNVLLKPWINTFLFSCSTQCLLVQFSPGWVKTIFMWRVFKGVSSWNFADY